MRSKVALSIVLVLVVGAAVILWLQRSADPDYRDVRPPTPVTGEVMADNRGAEPKEETPPLDGEPQDSMPPGIDKAACRARFSNYEKPSREEVNGILGKAADQLRSSGSLEHKLAAVKLDRELEISDIETLIDELNSVPMHDPLALWTKLTICEASGSASCDFTAIEANIRRNHSANSAFWMAIAGHYLGADQEAAALDAMRMVVGAPSFDSYLAEQYLNIDRALAATTNWSAAQRALHTMEFVASNPPGLSSIMSQCRKLDANWDALCDQLANKLYDASDEFMARAFGAALRVELHVARNGEDGASELREEAPTGAFEFVRDEEQLDRALNALLNDETLLRMFLENLESYGEIKAFELLVEDVERLRNTDGYDQCNFVANPYTRL